MRIDIMTLFPEMCGRVLDESIIGRSRESGLVEINCVNIRDFSTDKHRRVDDKPYGGGMGMIMQAQPIFDCYRSLCDETGTRPHLLYMTPQGKTLTQDRVKELAKLDNIDFASVKVAEKEHRTGPDILKSRNVSSVCKKARQKLIRKLSFALLAAQIQRAPLRKRKFIYYFFHLLPRRTAVAAAAGGKHQKKKRQNKTNYLLHKYPSKVKIFISL